MAEQVYRVVFEGQVEEGRDPVVVRTQLAALGLLNAEEPGKVLPGKPVVLESGLSKDQALHYAHALAATGARCRLVPCPATGAAPAASTSSDPVMAAIEPGWSPEPATPLPLATAVEPIPSEADKMMTCPKCGFEQEESEECQACGIIVTKFADRYGADDQDLCETRDVPKAGGQMYDGQLAQEQIYDGTSVQVLKSSSGEGFFAPEMRGIQKGVLGGIGMMVIAVVWFGLGYMAGIIFFYPPILFLFGLFALFKGLLTGNVSGHG